MSEPDYIRVTVFKENKQVAAGIGFKKQVRKCVEKIFVANIEADSLFEGTDLCIGDEIVAIEVPVQGKSAAEVARLIRESVGDVTILATRKSASTRRLRFPHRTSVSDYFTATVTKEYRNIEAGISFKKCARKSIETMYVAHISEDDGLFAETDLSVGDEIISIEVQCEGRTAAEVASLIRESEGDMTIVAVPKYSPPQLLHSKESARHKRSSRRVSPMSLISRSGVFHLSQGPSVAPTD